MSGTEFTEFGLFTVIITRPFPHEETSLVLITVLCLVVVNYSSMSSDVLRNEFFNL